MNKKGQALIEFIIILPVIIYLILGVVDYSIIIYKKNSLESKVNDIVDLYKNNELNEIDKLLKNENDIIIFDTQDEGKYTKITLKMKVEPLTPGINLILGKDYYVKCERVFLYE